MEFTNLFSPVHLAEDPIIGSDGQLYFNTTDNKYKVYYNGQWNIILDQYTFPAVQEFIVGSASANTVVTELSPMFSNNIVVLFSASINQINLISTSNTDFAIGSHVDIVRGGPGVVSIEPESGQELRKADDIFLTAVWQSARIIKTGTNTWLLKAEFPDIY